jgi:hypothetical protein
MLHTIELFLASIVRLFRSRRSLWLENLALRQQLVVFKRKYPRPRLTPFDKLFCVIARKHWPRWKQALILVNAETIPRWRILHFNVTRNPESHWVMQQLREAFPYEVPHKYMILDRDKKFGLEVIAAIRAMGSKPKRTSIRSPWQNGVAERWVESCRRDLLDHVIVLNERHLKRLLSEYVRYYHEDRTHLGLSKETPGQSAVVPTRKSI